jgi:hypothetical protein
MEPEYSDLAKIVGATILFAVTWAGSVAFVYWDAARRGLPLIKIHAWTGVAALAPFLGLTVYLIFRILSLIFSLINPLLNRKPGWVTIPKQPSGKWTPLPTLVAADLGKETIAMPAAGGKIETTSWMLIIEGGPEKEKEWKINTFPIRIGRGNQVDVSLDNDLGVSRVHSEIYEKEGTLFIRDMASTHGTQVNGKQIKEKRLVSGDKIQLGLTALHIISV